MTDHIGHISNIIYMFDQLKEHPYGSRTIIAEHINGISQNGLFGDVSGEDLVNRLIKFSEEQLLDVLRVVKAVYAIPTNRKVDTDSDSDSIEKFG